MKLNQPYARYAFLFILTFVIDRITKFFILSQDSGRRVITSFLSFELHFNRGMSWGMLHSEGTTQFVFVSLLTMLIIISLAIYLFSQWKRGFSIWGEVLVLSGALSNFVDRVLYGGVVDFISFAYRGWSWPVFNIADMCIVFGVFFIIIGFSREG